MSISHRLGGVHYVVEHFLPISYHEPKFAPPPSQTHPYAWAIFLKNRIISSLDPREATCGR